MGTNISDIFLFKVYQSSSTHLARPHARSHLWGGKTRGTLGSGFFGAWELGGGGCSFFFSGCGFWDFFCAIFCLMMMFDGFWLVTFCVLCNDFVYKVYISLQVVVLILIRLRHWKKYELICLPCPVNSSISLQLIRSLHPRNFTSRP